MVYREIFPQDGFIQCGVLLVNLYSGECILPDGRQSDHLEQIHLQFLCVMRSDQFLPADVLMGYLYKIDATKDGCCWSPNYCSHLVAEIRRCCGKEVIYTNRVKNHSHPGGNGKHDQTGYRLLSKEEWERNQEEHA